MREKEREVTAKRLTDLLEQNSGILNPTQMSDLKNFLTTGETLPPRLHTPKEKRYPREKFTLPNGKTVNIGSPDGKIIMRALLATEDHSIFAQKLISPEFTDKQRANGLQQCISRLSMENTGVKIERYTDKKTGLKKYRLIEEKKPQMSQIKEFVAEEKKPAKLDDLSFLINKKITELPFPMRQERDKNIRIKITNLLLSYLRNGTYSEENPLDVYEFIEPLLHECKLTFFILLENRFFNKDDESEDKRKSDKATIKSKILKYLEKGLSGQTNAQEILAKASKILSPDI